MQVKFFSIIVVALNAGEELKKTLDSILEQSYDNYEIILKDGGSTDGSLKELEERGYLTIHPQIRVICRKDEGIYDGMNQAIAEARGKFLLFLNCGDYFYHSDVLEEVFRFIGNGKGIYYGDQYNRLQKSIVCSAPRINDFTCYRNVPCHQVCFYSRDLFAERAYDTSYRVRADYEHFLYCIYDKKVMAFHMPLVISSYQGGGFSETDENKKISAREHRQIVLRYLGAFRVRKYRLIMWLSLAPLRSKLAESPVWSGIYNRIKGKIYRVMKRG